MPAATAIQVHGNRTFPVGANPIGLLLVVPSVGWLPAVRFTLTTGTTSNKPHPSQLCGCVADRVLIDQTLPVRSVTDHHTLGYPVRGHALMLRKRNVKRTRKSLLKHVFDRSAQCGEIRPVHVRTETKLGGRSC